MSRLFEDPDDMLCDLARFGPQSGIEGWWPQQVWSRGNSHLPRPRAGNVDHGFADFREEAIHKTGDEKLNSTHGFIFNPNPDSPFPDFIILLV